MANPTITKDGKAAVQEFISSGSLHYDQPGQSGCWTWMSYGENALNEYPMVSQDARLVLVHRLSFMAFHGPLAKGECALHTCDCRRCVNPVHLFRGSKQTNTADAVAKGRMLPRGRSGCKFLSAAGRALVDDVADINPLPRNVLALLAEVCNVPKSTIKSALWRARQADAKLDLAL